MIISLINSDIKYFSSVQWSDTRSVDLSKQTLIILSVSFLALRFNFIFVLLVYNISLQSLPMECYRIRMILALPTIRWGLYWANGGPRAGCTVSRGWWLHTRGIRPSLVYYMSITCGLLHAHVEFTLTLLVFLRRPPPHPDWPSFSGGTKRACICFQVGFFFFIHIYRIHLPTFVLSFLLQPVHVFRFPLHRMTRKK